MAGDFSSTPPGAVKLGAGDPIDRWGQHTLEGNLAFERGEDFKARQSYTEALAVAEEMMLVATLSHDVRLGRLAPALYGVACNNIIALAKRQGDGLTVGIFLCKVASGFLSVMESNEAPVALRSRCLLHSRLASAALCSYFEERGMWDAAETYTARANAAFFVVQRLQPEPTTAAPFAAGTAAHTAADPLAIEADPLAIEAVTLALDPAPAEASPAEMSPAEMSHAEQFAIDAALAPSPVALDAPFTTEPAPPRSTLSVAALAPAAAPDAPSPAISGGDVALSPGFAVPAGFAVPTDVAVAGHAAIAPFDADLLSPASDAPGELALPAAAPAFPSASASPFPVGEASASLSPSPLDFPAPPSGLPAPPAGGPPPLPAWVTEPPVMPWLTEPVWVPPPQPEPPRTLGSRLAQWVSRGFRRPARESMPSIGSVIRAK